MEGSGERGEGALGCVVVLVLAVLLAFVSFKVIPVYIDAMNFDEDRTQVFDVVQEVWTLRMAGKLDLLISRKVLHVS